MHIISSQYCHRFLLQKPAVSRTLGPVDMAEYVDCRGDHYIGEEHAARDDVAAHIDFVLAE